LDDEVIVGREAYGGRSLVHHRLAQSSPELCAGEDDGRFAMLAQVFAERAKTLPMLFDPESPSIALRPSPAALKNCLAWLSGTQKVRSQEPATDAVFAAPDALGWAYQYWNTEEKDRVFETVRTKKGAKIEGADIIPATQLYTEDYMVKFLVQNSLGATWMGIHPESKLFEGWEYFVRDADRAPAKKKPLQQITLLDPACGSGHFLIEAFDMFYTMYEEEGSLKNPEAICKSILEYNLFGIDIDERAIQIAEASLWMKAEEKAFGFSGANTNLVAATSSHLKGESWERYLAKLKNEPSTVRVLRRFAVEMEHIDELGSLARPAEALESIINEEHEIWEKQERERREADKSLFKEIRDDLLASQLPFQDISDKEFFERTMRHALFAIDGFTAEARDSGEFNDQLMGVEAKTGFRLLELLSKKYEVVVANPPYMGSKNMGPVLKGHINDWFKAGKRDLYAAFMLRALELCQKDAMAAFVTPQSWMFLRSFCNLRLNNDENLRTSGLLKDTCIQTLAHLGTRAFDEIGGEVVNVVLAIFIAAEPQQDTYISAIRVVDYDSCRGKAEAIQRICKAVEDGLYRKRQILFQSIEESPLPYWQSDAVLELLGRELKLPVVALPFRGLDCGSTPRFLRYTWEVADVKRWVPHCKGGGYSKWWGFDCYHVEWGENGSRIRCVPNSIIPNEQYYFHEHLTYSYMANGNLSVRFAPQGTMVGVTGPGFIVKAHSCKWGVLALLNSRIPTFLLRLTSPSMKFTTGYLERLSFVSPAKTQLLSQMGQVAFKLKLEIEAGCLTERNFAPDKLLSKRRVEEFIVSELELCALLLVVEHEVEQLSFSAFEVAEEVRDAVVKDTGLPSAAHPLILTDQLTKTADQIKERSCPEVADLIDKLVANSSKSVSDESVFAAIKRSFESTPIDDNDLAEIELNDQAVSTADEEDDAESVTNCAALPAESLLESISLSVKAHPLTVLSVLADGIRSENWRNDSLVKQLCSDQASVVVLRILGHRWPTEATNYNWIDDDGIVPITDVAKEPALRTRALDFLREEELCCRSFKDACGTSLEDWLAVEFFGYHISQFKKRPIAWQLQTSNFNSRKSPAFACLIHYHRVDGDTIAKMRTQYTGPLKLRFETELRSISSTPTASRSSSQAKRAVELEESITELQAFDEKLAAIAKSGFGPDKLLPTLRQNAFDDAMLSMKACWLQRLSVVLNQLPGEDTTNGVRRPSPLDYWQDQAIKTELHQDLAAWIDDALSHLSYFCSQVGPNAPDAKRIREDPINADFGSLIQAEIDLMQTRSMALACGVWWGKFDAAVLAPIRERIKILKAEQKELNAAIKEDRQPVLVAEKVLGESAEDGDSEAACVANDMPLFGNDQAFEQTIELTKAAMKARLNEVKAKIKKFTEEMDSKAGKAQAIRDSIQAWRLPDPIPDSLDFRPSSPTLPPLFDQVSSLDERRAPPKTIAEFIAQESLYAPDINDGVRVNIAPLQKAGILAADVLAAKDVDKAIADRAEWRADERRWVREGKLPQPGWWKAGMDEGGGMKDEETDGSSAPTDGVACKQLVSDGKDDK
jgi:hypothetical protein